MPRVKQVVARKDYPHYGIAKGQRHYNWHLKTGPRSSREYRQVEPPRPSQLTTSVFLGTIGDMELEIAEFVHDDSLPDTLSEFAGRARELGSEEREKFENMPDGLQQGDTGQMLEERADACDAWADEIEQAADALREILDGLEDAPWHELEPFAHLDPTADDFDEADTPTETEIADARETIRADACNEAVATVEDNVPSV